VTRGDYLEAAQKLHQYLSVNHWNGSAIVGPDTGIRFNARIGRFMKSYTRFIPWSDQMAYLQAQSYWIMANALMAEKTVTGTAQQDFLGMVAECGRFIRDSQVDGHWAYPNPEWRSRVATVEGCFAGLGLLTAQRVADVEGATDAAVAWHRYLEAQIGFRDQGENGSELAVNYFASTPGRIGGVPNNSTLLLWFLAAIAEATGNPQYLSKAESVIRWLLRVQLSSGELPYSLGPSSSEDRVHFLCYQYNAFQFLDLVHYFDLTGDEHVSLLLAGLAEFLASGLGEDGRPRYSCNKASPRVLYYGVAIARALSEASKRGYVDADRAARTGFSWALAHQRPDGAFRFHSTDNYGLLSDRRSYPRYLSMILLHLVQEATVGGEAVSGAD
jgi:hypothetical protein